MVAATGTDAAQRWLRDFGSTVRQLRQEAGLSQARLAERADVHVTYLSEVERGRRNVSLVNIHALAAGLDCHVRDLFPHS